MSLAHGRALLLNCAVFPFLLVPAAAQEPAGWRPSLPDLKAELSATHSVFHQVLFLTHHVGWAIGTGAPTLVWRTANAGETWERQPLFDGEQHAVQLFDIAFVDAKNGWLVGSETLRTDDGGESWEPLDEIPMFTPKTVLPLTPDVVLLGGTSARIYRTTDRGRTWNWTQLGRATDQQVVRLAPAADNALIAIVNRTDTGMGAIWRSTDGGVTWEQLVAGEKPLFDVTFRDGTRGVAVGDGIAYTSEDGGQSWKRVVIAGRKHAVEFIDALTVLAVGSRPKVAISQNGGKTWRAVEGPWNEQVTTFTSLAIVNGGSYYVGTGGTQVMVIRYFDPKYEAPFAEGTVAIPFDFKLPGGDSLAAGTYQVTIEHRGDEHIIELERTGAAPNDSTSGRGFRCPDPCEGDVPVEVQYDLLNLAQAEPEALQLKFSLEPSSNGLAIVADVPLRSRDLQTTAALLLAANPAEPREVTVTAQDAKKKGGGLFDRVRKAAQGDVKGALENAPVDPAAAAQRLKESRATTGEVYRIRVRYPIDLIRRAR